MNFPKEMVRFVDLYMDQLNFPVFFANYRKIDTIADNNRVFRMWSALIRHFLKTEFALKSGEEPQYKRVEDLPPEELYKTLDCLGISIGVNPHTGGYSFAELYQKRIQKF